MHGGTSSCFRSDSLRGDRDLERTGDLEYDLPLPLGEGDLERDRDDMLLVEETATRATHVLKAQTCDYTFFLTPRI